MRLRLLRLAKQLRNSFLDPNGSGNINGTVGFSRPLK